MSKRICRICLRTDINTRDIQDTLVDFHDEITEYEVYENTALKYCSICEYLLLKFYKFSQKCRQANKILKSCKREKNGGFPSHLQELLPLTSLGFSKASNLQQYFVIDGDLELIQQFVKQENDNNELENEPKHNDDTKSDILPSNEVFQENIHTDELGNHFVVKINNVMEILDEQHEERKNNTDKMAGIDLKDENNPSENKRTLSHINPIELKLEDCSSDLPDNDSDEDTSGSEMINELKKRIGAAKNFSKTQQKRPNHRKPLRNRKELEKVFDIKLFASEQEAKDELELRKTMEPYLSAEHKCSICYSVHKYEKLLNYHMRWHDPSMGDLECSICHMRFRKMSTIRKHKYASHYGRFTCKKCPMTTYQKAVVENHYKYHEGVIYTCKLCKHTFKHSSTFKTHMRLRHKTEHVCVTCARTFVSEKGLIRHRSLIHMTESKVDSEATAHCAPCGLTFANEQIYTVHIMNTEKHKDLANSIIACKFCGVRFEDNKVLKEHKRTQHPQNGSKSASKISIDVNDSYKCTICGKVGTSHIWVYRHVIATHPDSPYAEDLVKRRQHMCDSCGKCYTTIYALRDHMFQHTGVKPYACASCPARFTTRHCFTLHSERHASVRLRRHQCTRCGKKFASASNLCNHMRSHIQDRRFKCTICDKGFLHLASMREHVRGVHHNVRRIRKVVKREADTFK